MHELRDEVVDAFVAALASLGLDGELTPEAGRPSPWDAVGLIGGIPVVVEVKAVPSVGDVLQLEAASRRAGDAYPVLAGRRVSAAVRDALAARDMGYFDARGHLRLWRHPLLIDTDVPGATAPRGGTARPRRLASRSMLDVALAVLDGTAAEGVRATAGVLGRSPGTVSKQLAALRAAMLVTDQGDPTVPDLFEAVVSEWSPVRVPLADLPRPGHGRINERLHLGFEDPEGPGWVLSDRYAAAAWGAPLVLAGDAPPDFYVPNARVVSEARTLLGGAEFGRHACTVAIAPAPIVCIRRFDRSAVLDEPFLAPSPVVAALDLATDPARGREILADWSRHLPPEVRRVW